MSLLDALGAAPTTAACSRAGCREHATWRIDWRNPRIHSEDRRKTWLACDEHVEFLRGFLASRDFPLTVQPLAAEGEQADPGQVHPGQGDPEQADPGQATSE